jgi:ABC-type glycerol-3-phosphate transport system permease component
MAAWLLALVALLPFAQMVWVARKPRDRVDDSYYYLLETKKLPEEEVRRKVGIDPRPLRRAAVNSTVVSGACAALCVVLASMAGYAFAKRDFRGKAVLFDLVLVSMAVPPAILMMPLFRLTVSLYLYDTLPALILPFCVTGFGIFYMRYVISAVPDETVEAARLDGLSELGVLFRVVVPSVWPSVLTLGILTFITSWNSFVLPHALVASERNYTVAVLLGRLMPDFPGLMWNDIMAVVIASLIPVLAVYFAFNRWVLRAATSLGDNRSGR